MKLIHELMESRLYRNEDTLQGKKAEDLAKVFFLMVLTVEMLRFGEEKFAKDYAKQTMQYGDFEHMRVGCTDMGNLASILSNQDHYAEKIETDDKISVPLLQFKTYLRGVRDAHSLHANDRNFFLKLENYLNITDNKYKNFRRIVGDWEKMSKGERNTIVTSIKNEYNSLAQNNDLIVYFKDHYKKLLGESVLAEDDLKDRLLAALRKSQGLDPLPEPDPNKELAAGEKQAHKGHHADAAIAKVRAECSDAIGAMLSSNKFLYRAFDNYPSDVFVAKTRDDRRPLGTDPLVFELANRAFLAAGFKATRQNTMSCTSNKQATEQFGDTFFILPVNGFAFHWSPLVYDFGTKFGLMMDQSTAKRLVKKYKDHPEDFVEDFGFKDSDFTDALLKGYELSISGKYYAFSAEDEHAVDTFMRIMGKK